MKTRIGFVSNSSSSSFIVKKSKTTFSQLEFLRGWYKKYTEQRMKDYPEDERTWIRNYNTFLHTLEDNECNCAVGQTDQYGSDDFLKAIEEVQNDSLKFKLQQTFVNPDGLVYEAVIVFEQTE